MRLFKFIALLTLLSTLNGCSGRPDYSLSPSASTNWVTVTVNLSPQLEIIPLDVLYRSEKCQHEDYDSTTESHIRTVRGYNPQVIRMDKGQKNGLWQKSIAIEGGGKCDWKLSALRVGLRLNPDEKITQSKKNISLNYVFDFDSQGYSGGFGIGRAKNVSKDLFLNEKMFPLIIHHRDGEVAIELFAGDTKKEKWSRHYKVFNLDTIQIEPKLYLSKIVTFMPPEPPPGKFTATYSNGQSEKVEDACPDYEKLISME